MQQATLTIGVLTELGFLEGFDRAFTTMEFKELHTRERRIRAALNAAQEEGILPEEVSFDKASENPIIAALVELFGIKVDPPFGPRQVLRVNIVTRRAWQHYQDRLSMPVAVHEV